MQPNIAFFCSYIERFLSNPSLHIFFGCLLQPYVVSQSLYAQELFQKIYCPYTWQGDQVRSFRKTVCGYVNASFPLIFNLFLVYNLMSPLSHFNSFCLAQFFLEQQFPYFTCALRKVQDLREQKYFKTKCIFVEMLNLFACCRISYHKNSSSIPAKNEDFLKKSQRPQVNASFLRNKQNTNTCTRLVKIFQKFFFKKKNYMLFPIQMLKNRNNCFVKLLLMAVSFQQNKIDCWMNSFQQKTD